MIENGDIGFIKSGKYRIKIMELLKNIALATPIEMAERMSAYLSQVSRTISELEEKGLISCTTPNRKKGRIYRLTEKGRKILDFMEENDLEIKR